MSTFSTRQAAVKLGIPHPTLAHYIKIGKIPRPKSFTSGGMTVHVWTDADIERVRKLLPKLANGRKTRYQKQSPGARSQKPVEAKPKTKKKPQRRAARDAPGSATVPHKQHRKKH